jgi:hypothetical protein
VSWKVQDLPRRTGIDTSCNSISKVGKINLRTNLDEKVLSKLHVHYTVKKVGKISLRTNLEKKVLSKLHVHYTVKKG